MIASFFECKAFLATDKLGCLLRGEQAKAFADDLEFVIVRSKQTYELACAFITDKKPRKADYMLGFVYGYNALLVQKQDEVAQQTDEEDNEALIVVSTMLAKLEVAEQQLKDNGGKDIDLDMKIKDQNAFVLGFHDGNKAKTNLLKK